MKNIKKISLLLTSILLLSLIITDCSKEVTAQECAQVFWDMNVKRDISNISKINLKEEDGKNDLNNDMRVAKEELKDIFTDAGMKFTDKQVEDVCNALLESYGKVTVKVEEVSNDGKSAKIKYTTTYFDLATLDEKASNDAYKVIDVLGITDETEILNKYSELYIQNLINEFKNVTINKNNKEKVYTFLKEGTVWVPEDRKNFGTSIGQFITNQI
jgi:hypothetical protein